MWVLGMDALYQVEWVTFVDSLHRGFFFLVRNEHWIVSDDMYCIHEDDHIAFTFL